MVSQGGGVLTRLPMAGTVSPLLHLLDHPQWWQTSQPLSTPTPLQALSTFDTASSGKRLLGSCVYSWFLKGIIHTELVVSSDTHVFFP